MSNKIILYIISVSILIIYSCSPKAFVIEEDGDEKFIIDSIIKEGIKNNVIKKNPIIYIDGIEYKYSSDVDTIIIPLKKTQLNSYIILDKNDSKLLYNSKNGAVIINTNQ